MTSTLKQHLNVLNCEVLGICRNDCQDWSRYTGKTGASFLPENWCQKNDCSQVFNYLLPRFNFMAQGCVPYFAVVGHNCQKQLNCIHYCKTPCYLQKNQGKYQENRLNSVSFPDLMYSILISFLQTSRSTFVSTHIKLQYLNSML